MAQPAKHKCKNKTKNPEKRFHYTFWCTSISTCLEKNSLWFFCPIRGVIGQRVIWRLGVIHAAVAQCSWQVVNSWHRYKTECLIASVMCIFYSGLKNKEAIWGRSVFRLKFPKMKEETLPTGPEMIQLKLFRCTNYHFNFGNAWKVLPV